MADNNKNEPSILWQYVNGRRKASVFPTKLEYDNITATNDADKAKLFATFFSSVYVDYGEDSEILNYINNRNDHGCFSINITTNMVKSTLESMELNKGAGPDCIPPLFLRNCAETLAEPLSAIFAKSISKSIYPDRWKTCHIVPIHKSGAKSNVSNYRGVSIMPNFAKVFEKIINYQLRLAVSSQLSKSQHGFLSSRNIETNLMELSIHAHEAFKNNGQIDVFYADIQKAFDSVNQSLLIRKMGKFRISNDTLRWFISYFAERKQTVRVNASFSEPFDVPSSVGQGSILGPLLFPLFFNDSDDELILAIALNFADDKKLLRLIKSIEDTEKLQAAINNFMA